MKGDLPAAIEAAKRLAARLPVRTHYAIDDEPYQRCAGYGHNRPVEIAGVLYPSLRQGAKAHDISVYALVQWIDKGKARYA